MPMCKQKTRIDVVGIGMGTKGTITSEVEQAIQSCDCIIGAKRMLETLRTYEKEMYTSYCPEEILTFIQQTSDYHHIVIALSGDVGFYSGAKKLLVLLEALEDCQVFVHPGISSVVYLAAKLLVPWEDAELVSLHGTYRNLIHTVVHHRKTFVLLGDSRIGIRICEKLKYYDFPDLQIFIGSRLSYEDERIVSKTVSQLQPEDFEDLAVAFIDNPYPDAAATKHLSDEDFIRGAVPMTKEEIRTVNIAKLRLEKDSVVYDVGAGTGSISIEAAIQDGSIMVYAIEKNPNGIALIKENKHKFKADNLEIIEGKAPEALRELPAPTHVFIGGSSGNLREIIQLVKEKNPSVRLVMNAISLETIAEVMACIEEGLLVNPDLIQMSVSKSKNMGNHHLMMGENPIYIISC